MRKINLEKILGLVALVLVMAAVANRPAYAQIDPSGEWAPRFHEDEPERIPGPEIGDYLGLPVNDAARLRADSWDATLLELPENQCRPHPSDYAWRGPAQLRIWKEIDRESQKLIAYHTHISWEAPEQTIWMDGRPHPPDHAPHTWQGFRPENGKATFSRLQPLTLRKAGFAGTESHAVIRPPSARTSCATGTI